jgi:hypothetical protein
MVRLAQLREMADCPGGWASASALVLSLIDRDLDAELDFIDSEVDEDTMRAMVLTLARFSASLAALAYRGDLEAAHAFLAKLEAVSVQHAAGD